MAASGGRRFAPEPGAGERGGGGGPREREEEVRRNNLGAWQNGANFRRMREVRQGNKKQMLEVEDLRRKFGAKEENYFTLVRMGQNEQNGDNRVVGIDYKYFAKLLSDVGIKDTQVLAITRDPYRITATEIILVKDAVVNKEEVAKKLSDKNYPFEIIKFGKETDTIKLKGLPLTADEGAMFDHIRQAMGPYVTEVLNITPGKWNLQGEYKDALSEKYFNGKKDGNYYVQVVAKEGLAVPGFLPVGPNNSQVTVDYIRGGVNHEMLCNVCYEAGHMRGDVDLCKGGSGWKKYVEQLRSKRREMGEVVPVTEEDKLRDVVKNLEEKNRKAELEVNKLREEVAEKAGVTGLMEQEQADEKERMNREKERITREFKEQIDELQGDVQGRQGELNEALTEVEKKKGELKKMKEDQIREGQKKEREIEEIKNKLETERTETEKAKREIKKMENLNKQKENEVVGKEKVKAFISLLMQVAAVTTDVESFKEVMRTDACKELIEETGMEGTVEKYTKRLMSEDDDPLEKIMPDNFSELDEEEGVISETQGGGEEDEDESTEDDEQSSDLKGASGGENDNKKRRRNGKNKKKSLLEESGESPELKKARSDEAGSGDEELGIEPEKEKDKSNNSEEAVVKILERRSNQGDFSTTQDGTSMDWSPDLLHIVEPRDLEPEDEILGESQLFSLRLSPSQQMSESTEEVQHDAQVLSFESESSISSSSEKEEELRKAKQSVLDLFRNLGAKAGEGDFTEEDMGAPKSGDQGENKPPDKSNGQTDVKLPPKPISQNQRADLREVSWADQVEAEGTPGKYSPRPDIDTRPRNLGALRKKFEKRDKKPDEN